MSGMGTRVETTDEDVLGNLIFFGSIKRIRAGKTLTIRTNREMSIFQDVQIDLGADLKIELDGAVVTYGVVG